MGERLRMRRIVHDGAMCLQLKSPLPPRRDVRRCMPLRRERGGHCRGGHAGR
jgi:hypothetical protein